MKLFYEWGTRQLRKHGEELCGDNIAVTRHADSVTLALSDGLGSGVKANILATLTTQIAMRMLQDNLSLGEVVQTLSETLPVCAVRKVAYSTFAIAQFFSQGTARVVEFDSPPPVLLRAARSCRWSTRSGASTGRPSRRPCWSWPMGTGWCSCPTGCSTPGSAGCTPWAGAT